MLKFPALGAIVEKPLVDDVESPYHAIKLHIKLVGVEASRVWSNRAQAERVAEIRRLAVLRKDAPKDCAPEFWDPEFSTPEGQKAIADMGRDVLGECLTGVSGVDGVGDRTPVQIVEEIGALNLAMLVAINAQRPTVAENLSSGSKRSGTHKKQ